MNISFTPTYATGIGLATLTKEGTMLDAWFPSPLLNEKKNQPVLEEKLTALAHSYQDPARQLEKKVIHTTIELSHCPIDTPDAYLRLHLLSHCLTQPNTINVEGIFAQLPNNVWTNFGPREHKDFELTRAAFAGNGGLAVHSIDKFPRLVDYIIPPGVRISDANRVRLGAYLSPGTTVMHEGFVNFNAGTLGHCMVEGRISAGVIVGAGSDIGGSASIMGTLSGGGKERISLGKNVLLGANSGVGISLGDQCTVEAGLYITAGTKVMVFPEKSIVKASELSGKSHLLFIRNSLSGVVEARVNHVQDVKLSEQLHKN